MKLFEVEVPEIREQIIEIKHCVREPGARAKIAVVSKDRDVDPVGACVGMKGIRVQAVIQELKGEKIDIIPWSDNPMIFVRSALAPAEISSIRVDERTKSMEIMVEDDQLSLAIGRRGQNVRLAGHLTGWKLDIISKSKLQKKTADALFNLQHIEGINETVAQGIYQAGFMHPKQVSEAPFEALMKIPGYDNEDAAKSLKERAIVAAAKIGDQGIPLPEGTQLVIPNSAKTGSAKSQADERLKEMMKSVDADAATPPKTETPDSEGANETT